MNTSGQLLLNEGSLLSCADLSINIFVSCDTSTSTSTKQKPVHDGLTSMSSGALNSQYNIISAEVPGTEYHVPGSSGAQAQLRRLPKPAVREALPANYHPSLVTAYQVPGTPALRY